MCSVCNEIADHIQKKRENTLFSNVNELNGSEVFGVNLFANWFAFHITKHGTQPTQLISFVF